VHFWREGFDGKMRAQEMIIQQKMGVLAIEVLAENV